MATGEKLESVDCNMEGDKIAIIDTDWRLSINQVDTASCISNTKFEIKRSSKDISIKSQLSR